MEKTLHQYTKQQIYHYAEKERTTWILENLGMISVVGS